MKFSQETYHYLYDDLNATFYYKRKYNKLRQELDYADTEVNN